MSAPAIFTASRWTSGNRVFPATLEVGERFVVLRTRTTLHKDEISIHLLRIASVRVQSGPIWADLLIESSGGTDPIRMRGLARADAERIKQLIGEGQARLAAETPAVAATPAGDTRACPWCAETIKAAAKVCRYCGRDVS